MSKMICHCGNKTDREYHGRPTCFDCMARSLDNCQEKKNELWDAARRAERSEQKWSETAVALARNLGKKGSVTP